MGEDFDSGGFDSGGFDSGDFDSGSIEIDDFDTGDIGGIETTDYSVEDYMDSEPVDAIEFEDSFETTETYEDVSELSDLMDESSYEYETDIQDVSDEVAADTFETDSEYETETVSDYMTEETVEDVTADVTEETVEDVTVDVTEETMEVPVETTEEATAYDSMYEYMADHNYGREDYETYSKDPEWQALNNDLLEEMGRDPIDYGEAESGSAYDSMYDYMVEHNYGREDYETYSKDPEWQELNNDLLQEMGRDPIEYEETQELSDLMDETADEIPVEIAEEPVVEEPTEVVEEPVVEEPTEVVEESVVEETTEPNVETTEESSAYDNMYDYMVEHNYGREDYETYSKDPAWQELNNDLLQEMGRDPIEYEETQELSDLMDETADEIPVEIAEEPVVEEPTEVVEEPVVEEPTEVVEESVVEEATEPNVETTEESSAYDNMYDYMVEHNYGREDYETYSKDPVWQELNNDLLEETGREPIDYEETQELSDLMDETADEIPAEVVEEPVVEEPTEPNVETTEESSAYDNMYDYMVEHNYGREDYETYSKDPEWQALNNDLLEEMGREPIEYQDIVYDVEHNYEFNDVLLSENPEFNGMFESGEFYQQGLNEYGFNGTCGETTQANTFNHMLGTNEFTENDVLNIALEKDLCFNDPSDLNSCGGTSTEQFMQLYEEMNHRTGDQLNVELFDYDQALSINEMADRLDQGGMLNIAVDSKELWDEPRDMTPHNTDHWISVVGVDRDLSGNVQGFKIIDSGGGENYLDIDHFERCYYGSEDNPVLDPTCIVVSKKGK